MKLRLVLLLFLLINCKLNAQDQYFTETLKKLTSKKYNGRGYTKDGMKKASVFLSKEFKKIGLQPYNGSFVQTHTFPINIIQDAGLEIDGQKLVYGKDFIVKPSSKSIKKINDVGTYVLSTSAFIQSFENKKNAVDFIKYDEFHQQGKNIILPVLHSKVDSIQRYYKTWANTYENSANDNRAVFRFVSDSLTASLSQRQANVTEFIIKEKYYKDNLKLNDFYVDAVFEKDFEFDNLIGFIEGENNDSVVVIAAHYDHLGQVGKTIFPGASDNASGTAMVLSLANYYSKNRPKYKTVFMLFGAEEAGIVGSYRYVEQPLFPLTQIKFLINLDIMGAGEDGIQVVNGTKYRKQFDQLVQINEDKKLLKKVKIRGESCNSDHCPFDQKGVPSFFIYTLGGKGNYHNIYDTYQNLDLSKSEQVKELLLNFINGM